MVDGYHQILDNQSFGMTDNFFEHGGHSLKAIQLMTRIHKIFGVRVQLRDVFDCPTPEALSAVISRESFVKFRRIDPVPPQPHHPISHAQRRLWIASQFDEGSVAYNISLSTIIDGPFNAHALRAALNILAERHESLRTAFAVIDGVVRQVIVPAGEVSFDFSVTHIDGPDAEQVIAVRVQDEARRKFDLERAGLFRVAVIGLSDSRHLFLFTMHHIISDGLSMQILFNELNAVYRSVIERTEHHLPPLRIQYKDYTAWQLQLLGSAGIHPHRTYWHQVFKEPVGALELPADFARPAVKTFNGATVKFTVPAPLVGSLRSLARSHEASLFMVMFSAINTLLYKYTGRKDLTVGFTTPGRDHADLDGQIGFFVNALPVRTRFDGGATFGELLRIVRENILNAFEHQLFPFDVLLEELPMQHDPGRSPLFDVLVEYQNQPANDALPDVSSWTAGAVTLAEYARESVASKFDLTFFFNETPRDVEVVIEYNTDLFKRDRIVRLGDHFLNLLGSVAARPDDTSLGQHRYLPAPEYDQVMNGFRGTANEEFIVRGVIEQFEQHVRQSPGNPALIAGGVRLSYRELGARVDKLTAHLRDNLNIGAGACVGIMMERCPAMIVSVLAVMKSGAAYLPIDPAYPADTPPPIS